MYYLQLDTPVREDQPSRPREIVHGPFASANEAKGYWTKLTMWFPEALQGAHYEIKSGATADRDIHESGRRGTSRT